MSQGWPVDEGIWHFIVSSDISIESAYYLIRDAKAAESKLSTSNGKNRL